MADRADTYRDKLDEACKAVPPLAVEFAKQGTDPDGVTLGVYVIQVIAPCFTCEACNKTEPGQPTNLDRHVDTDGGCDPWSRKPRYTFDFAPPIDWHVDHEGTLCYECNQGVERAKSFVFGKARELWIEQRRKEIADERNRK